MKKILFLFCLFFFLIPSTSASTDFLVKKTTSWDETYTNNLQEISQNSSLTFEISALWWTSAKDYQINFPAWFIYNNHQISGNCTTNISHVSNSILKYQFSHSSACVSVVTFSYTPSIAGNYTLSILEWNTLIKNVQIWVTSNNTIIKAYSLDQNNNWYIDGYEIHFAQNTLNFNITWLKVWNENVVSYIWNSSSWIINFTDNIFTTGDLPQITSNGVTFWNVWMISNNSIIEEDMAAPVLSQINGNSVINSHTGYISTGSVVLDFSENLHPLSKNYFQIQQAWVNINGNFIQTGWIVTFSPTLDFWVWNYKLNILSWVKDYSNNSVSIGTTKTLVLTGTVVQNCTWLPENASWNSVWSISRYWNGSIWFPATLTGTYNETPSTIECRFVCNSGYTKSGNSCILSSTGGSWWGWWGWWGGWGWGWGWAGVSLCTDTQLECNLYNGNYVWLRKPWISCNGWNLGNSCQVWDQSSLWGSIDDTTWSQDMHDDIFYTDTKREEIKKYLLSSTHRSLHKIINDLSDMIHSPHTDFFAQYSKNFREDYKWLLIHYQELMIKINSYLITKERNTLLEAKKHYDNLSIYLSRTKNFEKKYITKIKKWNDIIYETKIKSISQPLSQIEKIMIARYKKNLSSGKISQTQYKEQIHTYNKFVLYLSIFRWEKNALSREYGKKAWEKVIQNYMIR